MALDGVAASTIEIDRRSDVGFADVPRTMNEYSVENGVGSSSCAIFLVPGLPLQPSIQ